MLTRQQTVIFIVFSRVVDVTSVDLLSYLTNLKDHGLIDDRNPGIVTRFVLQTYPNIKVQYTMKLYDSSDYLNILRATMEIQEAMEIDPESGIFVNFQRKFVGVGFFYADWPEESTEAIRTIFNLSSLMDSPVPITNGTMKSLVESMGPAPKAR